MKKPITFYKYHGAGNDFIIIDSSDLGDQRIEASQVALWCKRRYGIGADGLMVFKHTSSETADFEMSYFNADGSSGMMCGNGGRCIARFAFDLKGISKSMTFRLKSTLYNARVEEDGQVALELHPVSEILNNDDTSCYCHTGSPHHVEWVTTPLHEVAVYEQGKKMRNRYNKDGCNVNFVEVLGANHLAIRTYERGVEDETHACGTGITAAAISAHKTGRVQGKQVKVTAVGGDLEVRFQVNNGVYEGITLIGPAQFVFKGTLQWP